MKYTIYLQEEHFAITGQIAGQTFLMFGVDSILTLTEALVLFPKCEVVTEGPMPYIVNGRIVFK